MSDVQAIVKKITAVGNGYQQKQPGSREQLVNLAYALASAVELPSETIQRIGWAEVSTFEIRELRLTTLSLREQHNARLLWTSVSSSVSLSVARKANPPASLLPNAMSKRLSWLAC